MHNIPYVLAVLLWAALIVWELRSGVVIGAWWEQFPRISRGERPADYWLSMAIQGALFLYLLINGRSWPVR
jgi:uncharacterized membrane protein